MHVHKTYRWRCMVSPGIALGSVRGPLLACAAIRFRTVVSPLNYCIIIVVIIDVIIVVFEQNSGRGRASESPAKDPA